MRVPPTKFWDDAYLTAIAALMRTSPVQCGGMTADETRALVARAAEMADALYLERKNRMAGGS